MVKDISRKTVENLSEYIKASPTAYHAVANGILLLSEAGFTEWNPSEMTQLEAGDRVWCSPYPTCLFAFSIGRNTGGTLQIACAHTDSPCFHIKPAPDMVQQGYLRLNTDVYGGPILNSWLDRPLSVAGRVALRKNGEKAANLRLVDLKFPILTIPNLAIHMNKEVNKGYEWNPQTDLLPLFGMVGDDEEKDRAFVKFLADHLGEKPDNIMDFDLYVYNTEEASLQGKNKEFLSSPRLDNLTSCYALIESLIAAKNEDGIRLIAMFDSEEVGSVTARGADSRTLPMLIENLYAALGRSRTKMNTDILNGTMLSVDVAHAAHPNFAGKNDPTNQPMLNDGVVFKLNSNQRYINDLETISRLELLCEEEQIPYKKYVNRSDIAGGSTIGNKIASQLPMVGLDLGVPILAMHSARELMGVMDQFALERLITAFFNKF